MKCSWVWNAGLRFRAFMAYMKACLSQLSQKKFCYLSNTKQLCVFLPFTRDS